MRGHRSETRSTRRASRRQRTWTIVAIAGTAVLLGAAGVAAAATLLSDDDGAPASIASRRTVSTTTTTAGTTAATTSLPCRAGLTPDAPLRLWIAGDSIAHSVGNGLGKRAAGTGVVAPVYESRVSSGLTSPGFFDWPRRVTEELPRVNPEVVVFVMGTNDWLAPQPTPTDASGRPAWKADYERRVQGMIDALTTEGRTLYWLGPPVLRDAEQDAGVREIAAVVEEVVGRAPNAEYVDARDLLDGDDGTYTATVDIDGKRVQVRAGDGVHFTEEGGEYLGDAIFTRLDAQCRVKAQAVAGSRQPLVETRGSSSVAPRSTATAPPVTPTPAPSTSPPTTAPTLPPTTSTSPTTTVSPTSTTLPTTSTT